MKVNAPKPKITFIIVGKRWVLPPFLAMYELWLIMLVDSDITLFSSQQPHQQGQYLLIFLVFSIF